MDPLKFRTGREFTIFDQRGGDAKRVPVSSTTSNIPSSNPLGSGVSRSPRGDGTNNPPHPSSQSTHTQRRKRSSQYASDYPIGGDRGDGGKYSSGTGSGGRTGGRAGGGFGSDYASVSAHALAKCREWISNPNLPRINFTFQPSTTLKISKVFRPLKTNVILGADFNTQLGVWQFKSSWEDSFFQGRLTFAMGELQYAKSWLINVGMYDNLATRLRLRAAIDLRTKKAYARLGFRTEQLSPINFMDGFMMTKRMSFDGNKGKVKLETKTKLRFPQPEIEYSTENHKSITGTGDIEVNLQELNLLLNY